MDSTVSRVPMPAPRDVKVATIAMCVLYVPLVGMVLPVSRVATPIVSGITVTDRMDPVSMVAQQVTPEKHALKVFQSRSQ